MNIESKTYKGHISRYDNVKHFGFIEVEKGNSYFFFIDIKKEKEKEGKVQRYNSGDEVEFKLRPSAKDSSKVEAYEIKVIQNIRRQKLADEAIEKGVLLGYLKQIGSGNFFIKHVSTYVFVPIRILEWEIDLNSVYIERLNKLVEFRLTRTNKLDNLKAYLTDRKFNEHYNKVIELFELKEPTEALITGKNAHGLIVKLFNGAMDGFVHFTKQFTPTQTKKFEQLKTGDKTNVLVTHIFNEKKIKLTLTNSTETNASK